MATRGVVGATLDELGSEMVRIERRIRELTKVGRGSKRKTLAKAATTQLRMLLEAYGNVRQRVGHRMEGLYRGDKPR